MTDGQTEVPPQAEAQPPADTITPPAPPLSPQQSGVWSVPSDTAAVLRNLDAACSEVLQKLGAHEVEYVATKFAMMEDLKERRAIFKKLLDDAARRAGLDIDRQRWALDIRSLTLTRTS